MGGRNGGAECAETLGRSVTRGIAVWAGCQGSAIRATPAMPLHIDVQ